MCLMTLCRLFRKLHPYQMCVQNFFLDKDRIHCITNDYPTYVIFIVSVDFHIVFKQKEANNRSLTYYNECFLSYVIGAGNTSLLIIF